MVPGYAEAERRHILGRARELKNSRHSELNFVLDLTMLMIMSL
jgi:hypothetical protein